MFKEYLSNTKELAQNLSKTIEKTNKNQKKTKIFQRSRVEEGWMASHMSVRPLFFLFFLVFSMVLPLDQSRSFSSFVFFWFSRWFYCVIGQALISQILEGKNHIFAMSFLKQAIWFFAEIIIRVLNSNYSNLEIKAVVLKSVKITFSPCRFKN